MDFTGVLIVGFVMLCVYKVFELFVRKNERMLLVEKLTSLNGNEEDNEKRLKLQLPSIVANDSGFWTLRIALLLVGIGAGCLLALFVRLQYPGMSWDLISLANFACISLFGGIGLLIAFFLEQKKKMQKKD